MLHCGAARCVGAALPSPDFSRTCSLGSLQNSVFGCEKGAFGFRGGWQAGGRGGAKPKQNLKSEHRSRRGRRYCRNI